MDATKLTSLAAIFVIADLPWLFGIQKWATSVFQKVQGGLPFSVNLLAAVPVYFALAYLISYAANRTNAFFIGLSTYAVYDFTNLATLAKYDPQFAIADTLWGATLFSIVYEVGFRLGLL